MRGDDAPLQILFAADVPPDPDSGAAGTEYQTIAALRELGHHVDAIWADDLPRRIRHGNLHYLLELPRTYRRVVGRRLERTHYDVVHVNQGHGFLLAKEFARGRYPGVFVCRSHGLDDNMGQVLGPWRRRLGIRGRSRAKALPGTLLDHLLSRHLTLAYRYADGVLVSSSLDRDYLIQARGVEAARVGCVPQAPATVFREVPAPSWNRARQQRLLHVGSYAFWKDPMATAAVVSAVLSSHADATMTWVCPARDHQQIRAMLDDGVRDRVELHDWMAQQELVRTFDRHGVFLFLSLFEGFGKVFLEAMARGLCVVATPAGGARDIVVDGENGLVVPFHDAQAVVARIEQLFADADLAARISAAAAATARQYSWQRVAIEVAAFYRQLIALEAAA